jgi:hypothetical protein
LCGVKPFAIDRPAVYLLVKLHNSEKFSLRNEDFRLAPNSGGRD